MRRWRRVAGKRGLVVVQSEPGAPDKPAVGAPCNGCGVCCLAEPCPLGILLSGRRTGACAALVFSAEEQRYRCGALTQPERWGGAVGGPLLAVVARRWISAGTGCDCDAEVSSPEEDAR